MMKDISRANIAGKIEPREVEPLRQFEKGIFETGLVRISRTCIMNTDYLREIRQIRNSHLEAVMDNDEKLIVSRKYLPEIKKIFKRRSI